MSTLFATQNNTTLAPALAQIQRRMRLADLETLPPDDGIRYEILQGKLIMTPAPRRSHMAVATRLVTAISSVLSAALPDWSLAVQPINLELETETVTYQCQPDLSIFDQPLATVAADESLLPVIVLEIVSPGNPENDYIRKVDAYAQMGIPEYWIVDPGNLAVTYLALVTGAYGAHYAQITASALLPDLTLIPADLFAGL